MVSVLGGDNSKKNRWIPIVIWGVIVLGTIFRIVMYSTHFTHVDDMGYIASVLDKDKYLLSPEQQRQMFFEGYGWTYGPANTFLLMCYLDDRYSYMATLLLGRLPSLLFGICAVLVTVYIIKRYICENNYSKSALLAGAVLMSLSWEQVIYSAQAEPYSIGLLFVALIIWLIWEDYCTSVFKSFLAIICFVLACYFQYQMFMVVFAAVVSLYLVHFKEKITRLRAFATGVSAFVITIPLLNGMSESGALQRGVNWNAGLGWIFLFNLPRDENSILYIIKFFVGNAVTIFKYIFAVDKVGVLGTVVSVFLLALAIIGIVKLHDCCLRVAVFQDVLLVEFLIMILRGSLTFGPSRHILFIIPLMVIDISLGIYMLKDTYKKADYLVIPMLFTIIVAFTLSAPYEFGERRRLIDEKMISSLALEYDVEFLYEYAGIEAPHDMELMKIDGYHKGHSNFLMKNDMSKNTSIGKRVLLYSNYYDYPELMLEALPVLQQDLRDTGYDVDWSRLDECRVIYSDDVITSEGVEYASNLYYTKGNEKHLYVLEF